MNGTQSGGPAKKKKGFAAMSPARRKEIARMGGVSTAPEKRFFSLNREAAASAGRKRHLVEKEADAGELENGPPPVAGGGLGAA